MPLWTQPPRRLIEALRRLRGDAYTAKPSEIVFGTVQTVNNNATYDVQTPKASGQAVPATGTDPTIRAGDQVPVALVNGEPVAIFGHAARRAQFHSTPLVADVGIIEELFIATHPKTGLVEVFFRNYDQIVSLDLRAQLPADPVAVLWGVNTNTFGVRTGTDTYHVFQLQRDKKKIFAKGAKVKVKTKLYSVTLSDLTTNLTTVSLKLHRNSAEPVVETDWHPGGTAGLDAFFVVDGAVLRRDTNINQADVQRTVTIKLQGASTIQYTCVEVAASEVVTGNPTTASLVGVIINENDDLIFTAKVVFDNFGLKQGNPTTGLTGSYHRIGEGVLVFGGVAFVASCPWVIDDVGVQDFNGHGGVGGVLTTQISETHFATINAHTGVLIFTTFAPSPTVELDEDHSGLDPYAIQHFTGMPVVTPQCWAATTKGFHADADGPISPFDFGNIGMLGVVRSDRDLFSPNLDFAPDLADKRTVLLLTNSTRFWYDVEPQGSGFGFNASNATAQATWTVSLATIKDRYRIRVVAMPFYSADGVVYQFVGVLREPNNAESGLNDPIQVAAFLLLGSTSKKLFDYTTVTATDMPTLMAGNSHRVIWRIGPNWYMSAVNKDLTISTQQIGSSADATDALALVLTNPDFLYDTLEPRRYFVKGWAGANITLNQNDAKFPPKDLSLVPFGALRDLPNNIAPQGNPPTAQSGSYQTIQDTSSGATFPK